MGDLSLARIAPILSLSADIWSNLSLFLPTNSAVLLTITGCPALASRVSRHCRDLKLCWNDSRFMDFEEVCATINSFHHIQTLNFSSSSPNLLSWAPVDLNKWPSTLSSLTLNFLGSVTVFMTSGGLNTVFPNLEVLDLSEKLRPYRDAFAVVNFDALPPRLRILRISAEDVRFIAPPQLKRLPAQLEELHLNFSHRFKAKEEGLLDEKSRAITKAILPPLPHTITHLRLGNVQTTGSYWHIDWAALPRSLTTFEMASPYNIGVGSSPAEFPRTTSITPDPHLGTPNLRIFDWKYSSFSLTDALKVLPPSVTRFNAIIIGDLEAADSGIEHIINKLVFLARGDCPMLDELFLSGVPFPMLETLHSFQDAEQDHFASNAITSYRDYGPKRLKALPETLTLLWCQTTSLPLCSPSLPHLTSLHLFRNQEPTDFVPHLPNSLTELECGLDDQVALPLFNRMSMDLPHLTRIDSSDLARDVIISKMTFLPKLPPQLKTLSFALDSTALLQPLDASILTSWRASNLHKLRFHLTDAQSPLPDSMVTLLNNLPQKLGVLNLASPWSLVRHLPLILPESLLEVSLESHLSSSVVQAEGGGLESSANFVLPSNLRSLLAFSYVLPWSVEELPLHLSHLYLPKDNPGLHEAYIHAQNTRAPRPGLHVLTRIV